MEKIRAIIVDDEEGARNVINLLVTRFFDQIEIVAQCSNVLDAVNEIKTHQPHLVFLDIQMPNYAGYEIINFFDKINFEIIFVTAFDNFALKAFELSAIDYLLKPVNRIRFVDAVQKAIQRVEGKCKLEEYDILFEGMKKKELDKIVISELGSKRILRFSNIIAIEAKGAYSLFHLIDDKELLVSKPLKHFESVLPEETIFFRSHRAWIINLKHIITYSFSNNEISMSKNVVAKVSKYRVNDFKEIMNNG